MVLKPIIGLRVLTVAITVLLIVVMVVLPKGSTGAADFLLGAALGLSIAVQTIVWGKDLHCEGEGDSEKNVGMSIR